MYRRPRSSRRGTALVITVGLLAVLAVVGFGFAVLMKLNVETSGYYAAASKMDLLAHAVFAYGVRDIRSGWSNALPASASPSNDTYHSYQAGAAFEPTDSPACPWYIDPDIASGLYKDSDDGYYRFCYSRCASYALVHDVLGDKAAVSFAKVLDSAGKINVNDDNPMLPTVLDTLFNELNLTIIDPDAPLLTGSTVITYRNTLLNQRYTTLEQLKKLSGVSERRFDVLKHYLTIYSWPHDPPSVQGFEFYPIRPNPTGPPPHTLAHSGTGDKRRSPININTAPREVLVAILKSIRVDGGTEIGLTKAREIAKWITRKRDPENKYEWTRDGLGNFTNNWINWLQDTIYKQSIRKHTVESWTKNGTAPNVGISGWRHYPLGPFDSWNEFADFIYSLTNNSGTGINGNPFDRVLTPTALTPAEAEAILAALNPNPMATLCPRNTWAMSYGHLRKDGYGQQRLRDRDNPTTWPQSAESPHPSITGKNDLASNGYTAEVCFSSRGRYEIFSRTFAFIKADTGKALGGTNLYRLIDTDKSWGTAPPQWRGYSVLIHDGKGKGQLRGIVANGPNYLTVPKWSTGLDATNGGPNQSRYYVVGPGPLLDRCGMDPTISVQPGTPHKLYDSQATWEDDEWNGYRIVVYKGTMTTETGPGGKVIQSENIAEQTVQERVIIDTDGSSKSLILSPELNTSLPGGTHWSYIILGSYSNAAHDAALKAYDVIHHSTQRDFTRPGYATNQVDIGPNPIRLGVSASEKDGYITVQDRNVSSPSGFLQNFRFPALAADRGGSLVSTSTANAQDVFGVNAGNLFPDGLYLRSASGRFAAYRDTTGDPIVTNKLPAQNGFVGDGGFVSFWFRPDQDCMSGAWRTLIRIKGQNEGDDIRLRMWGTNLRLEVRVSDSQPYGKLTTQRPDGTYGLLDVFCYPGVRYGTTVNVASTANAAIYAPWRPGEWHHIAFAWYEAYDGPVNNSDGNNNTDMHSDGPTGTPNYSQLDKGEVLGSLRLWLDGTAATALDIVDAFNLIPDLNNAHLWLGEPTYPAAGTLDGVVAYSHTDRNLTVLSIPSTTEALRYEGTMLNYSSYTSPTITLPPGISGEPICLGTIAWTAFLPWTRRDYNGQPAMAYNWGGYYPLYFTVTLNGIQSKEIPANSAACQPVLGGGGPVVNAAGAKIHVAGGTTITYRAHLSSYQHNIDSTKMTIPQYWQTPLIDDVTITYLGPVSFYHWR